jgi:hypothetical protein
MSTLMFWLIALNLVLLAGVIVLSLVLRQRRPSWQMDTDANAIQASPQSLSETSKPMAGLLVRSTRDLEELDSRIGRIETDVESRIPSSALGRDVAELRRAFEAFSADMRAELNFLRGEIMKRETTLEGTWIETAPSRNRVRRKK